MLNDVDSESSWLRLEPDGMAPDAALGAVSVSVSGAMLEADEADWREADDAALMAVAVAEAATLEATVDAPVGAATPETVEIPVGCGPVAEFRIYEILSQSSLDAHFSYILIQAAPPQFSVESPAQGMVQAPSSVELGARPLVMEFPQ